MYDKLCREGKGHERPALNQEKSALSNYFVPNKDIDQAISLRQQWHTLKAKCPGTHLQILNTAINNWND